jgi:UDP-glucose 4-epimerase
MRILVTGGAGFIGSHVVDAYLAAGHEVVVADDLSAGRRFNVSAKADFYPVDITSRHLADLFLGRSFDILNHHAGQVNVRHSVEDPAGDAAINIGGTLRLLELCRRHGVRRIVFSSSGGALYGDDAPVPTPEDVPARPMSPYGVSKLAVEQYVDYYHMVHGMRGVILRYANVYGPRQDPYGEAGVVAIFCQRLLRGEEPIVYGDGEQTRDFVYVSDVAAANLRALDLVQHQVGGGGPAVFNIGTGQGTTINKLLERLVAIAGGGPPARYGPARPGEQRHSAVDPARARDHLGWTPSVPLADGLGLTFDWFKRYLGRS